MENRAVFTKILAIVGTALVLLPIAAMLAFSATRFVQSGRFQMDYLIPAEVFPVVLVGSGLLIWAAWRAKSRLKLICWSLAAAVVLVFAGQGIAIVTGLASGATEPEGWPWALVLGTILLFDLLVALIGIVGLLLIGDLFKKSRLSEGS